MRRAVQSLVAVVAMALAGCGAMPFQQVQYDQYGNPIVPGYGNGGYTNGGNYYNDPYSGGGYNSGYNSGYGYGTTPSTPAYPASGPLTGNLSSQVTVGSVKKVKKGLLLWAKLEASGQIRNGASMAVTGDVTFHFTYKGKVVETRFEQLADLQPGGVHNFSVTSKERADDLQVVVSAQPGVTVPQSSGSAYGGGYDTGYGGYGGSTYGNNPYSSSSGYGTPY